MKEVNLYESSALREHTMPVIRPGGFQLTSRGLAHCCLAPDARLLDVGCGTGATVDYLRRRYNLATVGLDASALLLQEGIRNYGASPLMQARAEQLPVADNCFNAVLCECVLSLCPDPLYVLREIRRTLKLGGYLVLTDVYVRRKHAAIQNVGPTICCCLKGAVDQSTTKDRITGMDFDLMLWEDHSSLLKQLAAQLIWSYGSLNAFWSVIGGPDAAPSMSASGTEEYGWPGYYLLVAQKK
jgi:SAM-dependent methyltransferase